MSFMQSSVAMIPNIETIVLVGMGAGGIFLKAVYDKISKGLKNYEMFY